MVARQDELAVYLNEDRIGRIWASGGRLTFEYLPEWQDSDAAFPLSYSLPLARRRHTGAVVANYLWNLLPDNDRLLQHWAGRFGVSARNPLRLLANVGEDCAGAVRFLPTAENGADRANDSIDWLDEASLQARIKTLAGQQADGRIVSGEGQFSLAGAQYKTALRLDVATGRWGIPRGLEPTTHILKPSIPEFEHQAWNEHFCLALARRVGLRAARSHVTDIGGHTVLVVSRYDRIERAGRVRRIHQEDACQALGVHPANKYEAEGGPCAADIVRILDASARPEEDRAVFLRALLFNLLIAGTDAHAKNYSLLWDAGSRMRLAPLYDINSLLPYTRPWGRQFDWQRLKGSMRIGNRYRLVDLQLRHIERLAEQCRVAPRTVLEQFESLCEAMPAAAGELADALTGHGGPGEFLQTLVSAIDEHCGVWYHRLVRQ